MAVKKIYYSMGEVAEMFDVRPSLIRHWESQFACLKPHKNQKGNRMFTEADIEKLKQIYHLVKERGMTLKGAAQVMRRSSQDELARQTQLLENLQRIRAALVEVREELKAGDGEQVVDEVGEDAAGADSVATASVPEKKSATPKPKQDDVEVLVDVVADNEAAEPVKNRAPRRKKKVDDDNKELFPFYEQSLF